MIESHTQIMVTYNALECGKIKCFSVTGNILKCDVQRALKLTGIKSVRKQRI